MLRRKIKLGMTLILLIGVIILSRKLSLIVTNEILETQAKVILIDPGHGGADPGKVGINGALEKDINLQIAEKVKVKLEESGFQVHMTRTDDNITEGKRADLERRIALINEIRPTLVLGIHQNSYTDPKIRGAQVFYYSESKEAREAASIVQEELLSVDPDNTREIKGNSSFYLLKNSSAPTIIVECGFLSNEEEANSLILNEYQETLAQAICTGITKWLD